jgi:hypothetical protein
MAEERTIGNECYSCQGRRSVAGDCHSQCATPDPEMDGEPHGKKSGWFFYPFNFDPCWKTEWCNNYIGTKKRGAE